MVLIEPTRPKDESNINDSISELGRFDEELKKLPDMPEFKDEKEAKKYAHKLWAHKTQERINQVIGLKKSFDKKREDIEAEVLYRHNWFNRFWGFLTGRQYANIGLIQTTGNLKFYRKPVKNQTVNIKHKSYVIRKPELLFWKGKPTLLYFENNPQPILFNADEQRVLVNSESLYDLFQARFVNQLFTGMDAATKAIMWSAGSLVALGITAFLIISALGGGNELPNTAPIFLLIPQRWFCWRKK